MERSLEKQYLIERMHLTTLFGEITSLDLVNQPNMLLGKLELAQYSCIEMARCVRALHKDIDFTKRDAAQTEK